MVFVVLEGFSGTGKTSLAMRLEDRGWLRLAESAHVVPAQVPVADRADTLADYSLLGATLEYSAIIAARRSSANIVAEGYLLGDLAYAKVRHELGKSEAFPAMLAFVREVLKRQELRPDLYILLRARPDTISNRQQAKGDRERNVTEFFQSRYYSAVAEIHAELGETRVEELFTDQDPEETLSSIMNSLKNRGLAWGPAGG